MVLNFLVVLDQGNMEIGLGAHKGTKAEIHPGPVGGHTGKSVLLTLVLLIITLSMSYYGHQYVKKTRENKDKPSKLIQEGMRPEGKGLWRNRYLPSGKKETEVDDDNSLLDGAS